MSSDTPMNGGDDTELTPVPASFDAARARRFELGDAADVIELFLARPASDPSWSMKVFEALEDLRSAFSLHVHEVERPDGLLSRLVDDEPRLANGVSLLHSEHGEIDLRLTQVADLIRLCMPDCEHTVIEEVRAETVDVLSLISRHRQTGADLVYEAYHVDIGGG